MFRPGKNGFVIFDGHHVYAIWYRADMSTEVATHTIVINNGELAATIFIDVKGNGDFAGIIYAPNADLKIVGNGNVSGAAVGENITMTGNAAFHYDLNLKNFDNEGSFSISRWRELRGATEWLDFSSTSSLASSDSPL